MKNIIVKIVSGLLFSGIGLMSFALLIDYVSRPLNSEMSLNFIQIINRYFFAFSYGLGTVGTVFGAIILAAITITFFLVGIWCANRVIFQLDHTPMRKRKIQFPNAV